MALVPNVPGVPALTSFSTSSLVLLAADTALNVVRALTPQWGLYLNGSPVIASSLASLLGIGNIVNAINDVASLFGLGNVSNLFSVVEFEFRQDWSIATYPVEGGGFLSYDKVQHPFDIKMRIAAGGTDSNRRALINVAEQVCNSLDLYVVVTPERMYSDCNPSHYDYRRAAVNGVGLIIVDIWFMQIRQTATSSFTSTQQPSEAGQQSSGTVQAANPTPQQSTQLSAATFQ